MAKYRKKPIVIDATQWFKNGDHPEDGPSDKEGKIVRYFRRPDRHGTGICDHCSLTMRVHGWIDTLEGGHVVCPGDFVITGVKGERYPCKPDIFAATYDLVGNPCPHCGTILKPLPAWTGVEGVLCPNCGGDIRTAVGNG